MQKISCWNNKYSTLGRLSKLWDDFPLCFSQLHLLVDLEYHFVCGSFGLEFFHMCKQHKYVPTPKIPCEKKILQSLGGCQSWQLWNISYSYPLLVNLEYLFLYQSSSFEIWYTCCQHNNDFVSKISCINNNFPALGRVSKLAAVWALSLELHKGTISVSPHCTVTSELGPKFRDGMWRPSTHKYCNCRHIWAFIYM